MRNILNHLCVCCDVLARGYGQLDRDVTRTGSWIVTSLVTSLVTRARRNRGRQQPITWLHEMAGLLVAVSKCMLMCTVSCWIGVFVQVPGQVGPGRLLKYPWLVDSNVLTAHRARAARGHGLRALLYLHSVSTRHTAHPPQASSAAVCLFARHP